MNNKQAILNALAQTTVNTDSLRTYLNSMPHYFEMGNEGQLSEYQLDLLISTDYFEFHLRRYLSGHPKTLHRVFWEIREFLEFSECHALEFVTFSLESVKEVILLNEWYELMPRYQNARNRIEKKFGLSKTILDVLQKK